MLALILAAAVDLWPGFDINKVPVAVFDGKRTVLRNHPSPPAELPVIVANTSIAIGGVETATVMRDDPALIAHETFHVYQRTHHPKWGGNEVDLFAYPIADADALALQRLELEALRRALRSKNGRCWTRAALNFRRARFAKIGATAAAYERGTELNEGLATYVEHRVSGRPAVLHDGLPEAVRDRAYQTGHALALLLDRFAPQWRESLERDDTRTLDELLDAAVRGDACAYSAEERMSITVRAHADARGVQARLAERRRTYLDQPGWTVTIDTLLFPERFDPLNVQVVGNGEVLHTRHVKLSGEAGSLEVLDRHALTEAAGAHPLFNGVRRVVLTGFASEPRIDNVQGVSTIHADGVKAALRGARVTIARAKMTP